MQFEKQLNEIRRKLLQNEQPILKEQKDTADNTSTFDPTSPVH